MHIALATANRLRPTLLHIKTIPNQCKMDM